jgi:3',5'-cyclic AMP phosphodiesterase CpdA
MKTGGNRALCVLAALLLALAFLCVSCGGENVSQGTESNGDHKEMAANDFSFLVCGDPHGRTDILAEIIGQLREGEFLVITGDLTNGKSLQEMKDMKAFLDGTGVVYYVIPGDNDMPQGDPSNFNAVFGNDYYSIDVQQSHLVFLNDAVQGVGCPSGELGWLREDLAAVDGQVVIGFAHVPPGAPVGMEDSQAMEREAESNQEMLGYLEKAGAAVLYCGHLHVYMLYSSGPPRIVVSGGAGATPHLSEQSGGYHHFLRVTVTGDRVSEEVVHL